MRLWTIQPISVIDILEKTGEYTCEKSLSINYEDFRDAYEWLVKQMDKKNIVHPDGLELPLWAWHTYDGIQQQPNVEEVKGPGKCVCIEFEIPDNKVCLTDYNAWHYVLNRWWLDDSTNEEEWDKNHEWFDNLNFKTQDKIMKESWKKIFDITFIDTDWSCNGKYVQATFWKLEKSMIKSVKYFEVNEVENDD